MLAGMFATSVSATSLDYIEVTEIEKINHNVIMNLAKVELKNSLKNMPLKTVSANKSASTQLATQVRTFNQDVILANIMLIAE
jgi:hypothetical protein